MVWEGRDAVKTGRSKLLLGCSQPHAKLSVYSSPWCHQPSSFSTRYHSWRLCYRRLPTHDDWIHLLTTWQDVGRNVCHGSDAVESAKKEIALWFKPEEIIDWKHSQFEWVYEKA